MAYQQARINGNYRAALTALGQERARTGVDRLLTDYFSTLIHFDTQDRDVPLEVADERLTEIAQELREAGEDVRAAEVTAKRVNLWVHIDDPEDAKRGASRILAGFFTFCAKTEVNQAIAAMADAQYLFPEVAAAIRSLEKAVAELVDLDPCTREDLLVNLALMHVTAGNSVAAQRSLAVTRLPMEGMEPFWDTDSDAFMNTMRWYGYVPPVVPPAPVR